MSHFPRKRFGQHFLHDKQIRKRIIAAIAPQAGQHLVEIGPGQGALTLLLLHYHCQLDVIELDRDLVKQLEEKTALFKRLRIFSADVLKFNFRQLLIDNQPLRIVGNLPYNISTALLFYLLPTINDIQDMIFMLQKEVVDRIVATPTMSHYGRLSVMLQYHFRIEKLFEVDPNAFYPPPKVNSSVVRLIPYAIPPVNVNNDKHFAQIVKLAFSQRRKTLRNTLKGVLDSPTIRAAGVDPQARGETLTLQDFARLSNQYTSLFSGL